MASLRARLAGIAIVSAESEYVAQTLSELLGALDEAALYVSRATDADAALHEMYEVCDRVINGITGGR